MWLWRESLVVSAIATYCTVLGSAMVVLTVLPVKWGQASAQGFVVTILGVLWIGTLFFFIVGWVLIVIVSFVVAGVRYLLARRSYGETAHRGIG